MKEALTEIKGNAYLPARQRVRWMREEHKADWSIITDIVELDFVAGYAIVRATVSDKDGRIIATARRRLSSSELPLRRYRISVICSR